MTPRDPDPDDDWSWVDKNTGQRMLAYVALAVAAGLGAVILGVFV